MSFLYGYLYGIRALASGGVKTLSVEDGKGHFLKKIEQKKKKSRRDRR